MRNLHASFIIDHDNMIKQSTLNEPSYIYLFQNQTPNFIAINEKVSVNQKLIGKYLILEAWNVNFILSVICSLSIFMYLYLIGHDVKQIEQNLAKKKNKTKLFPVQLKATYCKKSYFFFFFSEFANFQWDKNERKLLNIGRFLLPWNEWVSYFFMFDLHKTDEDIVTSLLYNICV